MEEKIEEIMKQYPVRLVAKRRIRGAILLETKEGLFSLQQYQDSIKKLEFQEQVKQIIEESGYSYIDTGIPNETGELLTKDGRGNRWLLKKWFRARECNLYDENDIEPAVRHLAKLHNIMQVPSYPESGEMMPLPKTEKEVPGTEKVMPESKSVTQAMERHIREMKRVYNYIRNKKQRNEMELCILQLFPEFYEQAGSVQEYFSKIDCDSLWQNCIHQGRVYHGNYNYHNVLFQEKQIVTTNFEGAGLGIQITDLYDFLRKIMEKNNWDTKQGIKILDSYCQVRMMQKEEAAFLYLLFLFPEKFWKQINFYYNGKKSWMSVKNYDKLLKIKEQEQKRRKFLTEAKGLLFYSGL